MLLIERCADVTHILSVHPQDLNRTVQVARDGMPGLQRALAGAQDVVVLDLLLRRLGGLEICGEPKHCPVSSRF